MEPCIPPEERDAVLSVVVGARSLVEENDALHAHCCIFCIPQLKKFSLLYF